MQRKGSRLAAVVGTGVLVLCASAASARQATTTTTETKKFEVVAVDGNRLVLRGAEGTKEFTVPEDFRFDVAGQMLSVHQLKPGMSGMATITTRTTTKPVTVTEVKNGTVEKVLGSTIIVRTAEGFRMFSQGDVDKRQIQIVRDGAPVKVSELQAGDRLSATIITEKPPQVMTERQVQASITGGAAPATASAAPAADTGAAGGARASATTGAAPAGTSARRLPKTASPLPLVGLLGAASLALGFGLTSWRRRRTPR